jgi:signal transduction histidine kinase
MILASSFLDWFTGDGRYMTLYHCMGHDKFWVALTVALDFAVAAGYVLIAMHWARNQRHLPPIPAKRALGNLRNIFVFCGICGYIFIPVKMVWPAWRLYDLFLIPLVYFTWRYAWGARDLKVIYHELGRSRRLEADLDRSREESNQKSFFLNAISHDLRTPLNGVLLQATLADVAIANNDVDTTKAALRDIRLQAKAAADLLNSFLEYARLESRAEPRPLIADVDVNLLVARTLQGPMAAAAAAKGVALKAVIPDGIALRSDSIRLERILANLVGNAVKFTEAGSVSVGVEQSGRSVQIHVIDTGRGIAPEHQDRLFDAFYQAHNHERCRTKGFGLGLSIAKRLAAQLGGDITFESSAGRGSRFSIVLPQEMATDSASASAPVASPVPALSPA